MKCLLLLLFPLLPAGAVDGPTHDVPQHPGDAPPPGDAPLPGDAPVSGDAAPRERRQAQPLRADAGLPGRIEHCPCGLMLARTRGTPRKCCPGCGRRGLQEDLMVSHGSRASRLRRTAPLTTFNYPAIHNTAPPPPLGSVVAAGRRK
jgi:hypothetical protein